VSARNVYHVVPHGTYWQVKHNGQVISTHFTKQVAVESGRRVAHANMPSQLVLHNADGTIETEWTYGNDPYPPRG
jgi:hypothetical protein